MGQFGLGDFLGHIYQQYAKTLWSCEWWAGISIPNVNVALGVVWVAGILIGCGIIALLSAVIAQGALISAAIEWYKKNKISPAPKLWARGVQRFWPLLFLNILHKVALAALLLFFGWLWMDALLNGGMVSRVIIIAAFTLELLLAMSATAIFIYAAGYLFADKAGLWSAIKKGGALFSRHLLVSLELSVVLLFVSVALLLAVVLFSAAVALPSLLIWFIAGLLDSANLMYAGLVVSGALFFILTALTGAVFNGFATSAWICLFMKMHHEGIASRLWHHLGRIIRRER